MDRTASRTSQVLSRDASPCYMEGWLFKEGGQVRNWKLRWFVLSATNGTLSYFAAPDDLTSLGVVMLTKATEVTTSDDEGHCNIQHGFSVDTKTDEKTPKGMRNKRPKYWVAATDGMDVARWSRAIRAVVALQLDGGDAVGDLTPTLRENRPREPIVRRLPALHDAAQDGKIQFGNVSTFYVDRMREQAEQEEAS